MKRVLIKDILLNEWHRLAGFIENIRDKKFLCFIVLRDVSGKIQLTINKNDHPELADVVSKLTVDSVICVDGKVIENPNVKLNGVEMVVDKLKVETIAAPSPIIAPKGEETELDLKLDYRWIDLRTDKNLLIFKVQSEFVRLCREFLCYKKFIEIHSPKLLGTASESGAEVFRVDYFDKNAYLAQSPQFYKQMAMAAGFERVFETGPVFRAEKSHSRKHATEFSGLDVEFSFIDSCDDVMQLEQDMLVYAMTGVGKKFGADIKNIFDIDFVVPQAPFPIVTLADLYRDLEGKYGYKVDDEEKGDLTTEAEKLCAKYSLEKFGHEFLFVTGFSKEKRAFYHMRNEDGTTKSYDLIWKGCEITTGAQREHHLDILKQQAEEKGLADDVKFYLEFFKYGCPPHGGFGLGIDRVTMQIFNLSIKECLFVFRGPDRLNP